MKKKFSISNLFIYLSLIISAAIAIVPLLVVLIGSFKTGEELNSTGVLELPRNFTNISNYVKAFVDGKMLLGFANTFFILAFSIIATLLTGTMTAYVLSRFKFKFRKIVSSLFLIASLVPSITMQMSTFQIINGMGLFNTPWSTIILFAGTDIISIYIFLQFLDNISFSIDESAIMDGASYFTIFYRLMIPLLKPAIMTVLILKGVTFYNDFYTPYLYMPKPELAVISTALFRFKGPYGTQWEVICAGVIITMLPAFILFLLLQKQIYSGMTAGAVKE
ncbi:carbohydrate ABC transporter permease [Anaerosacchariphilus polymeriproducens]|uniref:Carbohydrate ABC transporter permease n=1 Tax=Anaerosacchariphilus polymeriproducens TaxID=1812858 RepID=A0A371AWW1_9FIRM|nr:carbohydrate ABC transporter permease [Anaerosacchariphilus polymeriproducens]RDU24068.1 carbohydrate ABC transporter permease [Anaerosacchariphilus polymeriproducens]